MISPFRTTCAPDIITLMRVRLDLILIVLYLVLPGMARADELTFARFQKSAYQIVASQLLEEIYRRNGTLIHIIAMPPPRATIQLLSRAIDGEVSRTREYANQNPSFILVEPAYTYFTMAAFSRQPVQIRSKSDLADLHVGIIRGVQASEDLTAGVPRLELLPNGESLFLMLNAGRLDVAIDVDINGRKQVAAIPGSTIQQVGVLARTEAFHILASKNNTLAARISSIIREMRDSGELETLREWYAKALVQSGANPD